MTDDPEPIERDEGPLDDSVAAPFRRIGRNVGVVVALVVAGLGLRARATRRPEIPRALERPLSTLGASARAPKLRFTLEAADLRADSAIIVADRGKRAELVLVRKDDLGGFAVLHPTADGRLGFQTAMPSIPAGDYHLIATVRLSTGRTLQIDRSIAIRGGMRRWRPTDRADVAYSGGAVGTPFRFDDGTALVRYDAARALAVGVPTALRFSLRNADGQSRPIDPRSRIARAWIVRANGTGFTALGPSAIRLDDHSPSQQLMLTHRFPSSGLYRVWIELPLGGVPRIAAFDVRAEVAR